jgi:hypothetical protein
VDPGVEVASVVREAKEDARRLIPAGLFMTETVFRDGRTSNSQLQVSTASFLLGETAADHALLAVGK